MSVPSHNDLPPALLDRYLAGECSGEEVELVYAWSAVHPANAARLTHLRNVRDVAAHRPVWNVRGMWDELASRMSESEAAPVMLVTDGEARSTSPSMGTLHSHSRRKEAFSWSRTSPRALPLWARAAAALVLASSAALGWHQLTLHQTRVKAQREALADRTYTTYATQAGQRAEITLSDGSRVTLGVASTLKVPQSFNARRRVLKLEGEALFTVEHNAAKPFMVYSPHAVTEDIGTVFGVRAYSGETTTQVVVRSGEVTLRGAHDSAAQATHLTEREMGRVDRDGRMSVDRDVDPDRHLAWVSGRLVFDKTPLVEAAAELGRWYDLDVVIADKRLNTKTLTASFSKDPVRDVLHMIEGTLDVRIERHGHTVTLYAKGDR